MNNLNEKQKKFLGTVPKKYQLVETFWDCPEISKTNNKGITLIALIITIIVMLILVGVTINVALNGGIFEKAKTAATKTEEQAIYDKIIGGMDLGDNGKILVKETYSVAKNMLQGEGKTVNIVTPATEEEITNSVIFEVVGNNETYTYTITEEKIIIGKEEEKVYSFTLNSLGEWTEGADSIIKFEVNNVWNAVGVDLSSNNNYCINPADGVFIFLIYSDNEQFAGLVSVTEGGEIIEEKVQFLIHALIEKNIFEIQILNDKQKLVLSDNPGEGEISYQEFMDTYGDVEFRFADVSSIEISRE